MTCRYCTANGIVTAIKAILFNEKTRVLVLVFWCDRRSVFPRQTGPLLAKVLDAIP